MWQRLLSIQRRIVPEAIDELLKRFEILKRIEANQPIGRRTLARKMGWTERILRKEVDRLHHLGLILIDKRGIAVSQSGNEIMEELSPYITTLDRRADLARSLREKYGLRDFFIIRGDADSSEELQHELSKLMAGKLQNMFFDGAVISAAGGSTMANVSNFLSPTDDNLLFVPARGGLGEEVYYQANSIVSRLAAATGSGHKVLHAPDNVGETVLESLKNEPAVKEVTSLNQQSDYVIHGIGEAMKMADRRNVQQEVIDRLREEDAVGETFGYYFDRNGDILKKVKTIGLQLEDLASKKAIFAVAGGSSKKEAVSAYMKIAPENTLLFIDETIAEYLLNSNH